MPSHCRWIRACLVLIPLAAGVFAARAAPVGEDQFRENCLACHAISCNRTGPALGGVIGRKAGSVADFQYSDGLKNAGWTWTEELVNRWLQDPDKMVPGTRMTGRFRKVTSARDRKQLIQFIKRADTSLDLCGVRRN